MDDDGAALAAVTSATFDPRSEAVLAGEAGRAEPPVPAGDAAGSLREARIERSTSRSASSSR